MLLLWVCDQMQKKQLVLFMLDICLRRGYTKVCNFITLQCKNSYFLHWNFDWKSCFVVFFLEWNKWKNPQINFSRQNLSIEHNLFKWDGKVTKISHLLFHRIWKKMFFYRQKAIDADKKVYVFGINSKYLYAYTGHIVIA